jgi:glyoxylase-like metal-dependent hydrolase (beta-lactamase superfamily II)
VPGVSEANIYPLIRKIDTISSNSYLIETPACICLIDPGGLPEQVAQLIAEIQKLRDAHERPVVIFLTHAHIDHFLSVQYAPADTYFHDAIFAVQEAGADALERGDRFLTQADLLGFTVSPKKIDLKLLPANKPVSAGLPVTHRTTDGTAITITRQHPVADIDLPLEQISCGGNPIFTVCHTPGHSPDSMCLCIGRLLFIGDVLFAANPGIAGLCGWNQKALIRSLAGIRQIIANGGIDWVCPGHGRLISATDAIHMLQTLQKEAYQLENIAEFNAERAAQVAACADDCMEQVNELFTIMSGRLGYVSYVMEELGEAGVAEQMTGLIKSAVIDELLDAFRSFSVDHHTADRVSIHLALKAGQVMGKLERSFIKDDLAHIIDPTLVTRAEHLLSDYTTMLRGFCPPDNRCDCDVNSSLLVLVADLSCSRCSDEDILSSADDDTTFIRLLLSRIGSQPLLADIDLSIELNPTESIALVDRDLFSDLVIYIFEDLVGIGATRITLTTERDTYAITMNITGNTGPFILSGDTPVKGFLFRLAARAGGVLSSQDVAGTRVYTIAFTVDK